MSTLRIAGTLCARAYASAGPNGEAFVHVELRQGGDSLPLRAARLVGRGSTALYAANSVATQLRPGTPVTVHAERLELRRKPDTHLLIVGVDHIDHPPPVNPLEPKEAPAP